MGPVRYARFKRQLRETMRLASDELGRRRMGVAGDGTAIELEKIIHELARFDRALPSGVPTLMASRLARSWPEKSELRARIFRLASLINPELP